jgi:hypothetical protein
MVSISAESLAEDRFLRGWSPVLSPVPLRARDDGDLGDMAPALTWSETFGLKALAAGFRPGDAGAKGLADGFREGDALTGSGPATGVLLLLMVRNQ